MGHRPTPTEEIEAIGMERDLMGLPVVRTRSGTGVRQPSNPRAEALQGALDVAEGEWFTWRERAIMAESMLDDDEKAVLRQYMEAWTANR